MAEKLTNMIKINFFVLFILILNHMSTSAQTAVYKEEMVSMKTYPYSEPNPVPQVGPIYPYFRFDTYATTPVNQQWKMIEMENDYIKIWITPEIGGKIWGAVEKSTGKEFIYFNHTVKFRDIAMRGAWTSGGIEMNFGLIGHAPTCSSPVDYMLRTNDDGSVSCFLGTIDLPSRTRWSVEVILPPDKSYFITRSKWDNASLSEQSYYQWMNAAVRTDGNLEYIYPGKNYLGHDGQAFTWPVDKQGREISWYEKNNFGSYKSYHVFGSYTDFFGGYWHDTDFGFGHYAQYDDKPGKKIWIWGLSEQGMIWEDLLTDDDGQYTEIQSGRLFNQADVSSTFSPFQHRDFKPATTDIFEEYWFPVTGTRGLKYGVPAASFNLSRENNQLVLRVCPNSILSAKVEVKSANSVIFQQQINTLPQKTIAFEIDSKLSVSECTIWLDGQLIYDGNPVHSHTLRPTQKPADMNWNSVYGIYIQGKEGERQRRYQNALAAYTKCLSLDPCFIPALDGMAHLYYRMGEYKKSLEFALKALAIDTYEPAANYYYGLNSLTLGDTVSALDGFSIASTGLDYRSASYNALAGIYLSKHSYDQALEYAHKSLRYNSEGSRAQQLEAMALRLSDQSELAEQKLAVIDLADPLNHFCRFERYLTDPTRENGQEIKNYIQNEFPYQTFLEYSIGYHSLGQNDAARRILELAPDAVIVNYWLAYLFHLKGNEKRAIASLDKALKADPGLVFPYRIETKKVLEWALTIKNNWKTRYYIGLIDLVQLKPENALSSWNACNEDPDFYPFYIARARLSIQSDTSATIRDLNLALNYGTGQWRPGYMAAGIFEELGKSQLAISVAEKFYRLYPSNYYLGLQYAEYLNKAGRYTACIEILNKLNVLPNEGATAGRNVWRNSNLNLAIDRYKLGQYSEAIILVDSARQFPKNLGVGKTYFTDERLEDFIAALCYIKLNKPTTAENLENRIIATISDRKKETLWNSGDLITASLLRTRNRDDDAVNLMNKLATLNPDRPAIRWSLEIFNENYKAAGQIASEISSIENKRFDQSFPILLRLQNECGVFNDK